MQTTRQCIDGTNQHRHNARHLSRFELRMGETSPETIVFREANDLSWRLLINENFYINWYISTLTEVFLYYVAPSLLCVHMHLFIIFWFENDLYEYRNISISFRVFIYAFHLEMSLFFWLEFPRFNFCIIIVWYFPFPCFKMTIFPLYLLLNGELCKDSHFIK